MQVILKACFNLGISPENSSKTGVVNFSERPLFHRRKCLNLGIRVKEII